jgi:hypothetical protein
MLAAGLDVVKGELPLLCGVGRSNLQPGTRTSDSGMVSRCAAWLYQSLSPPSLQQRLFKGDGRLIRHARYFTLLLDGRALSSDSPSGSSSASTGCGSFAIS